MNKRRKLLTFVPDVTTVADLDEVPEVGEVRTDEVSTEEVEAIQYRCMACFEFFSEGELNRKNRDQCPSCDEEAIQEA